MTFNYQHGLMGLLAAVGLVACISPSGDATAPLVSVSLNTSSVTASGNITLTAIASDNIGVTRVEFYKNGTRVDTIRQEPFISSVMLTRSDNGMVKFTAKAFDEAGNSTLSAPADVAVDIPIWPKVLDTAGNDYANGVVVDQVGNVYIAGETEGTFTGQSGFGLKDGFVAKFDSEGNQIWLNQFGTGDDDTVSGISMDQEGNIYASGYTSGTFVGQESAGLFDSFAVKFNSNGNMLWIKQFGSAGSDFIRDIALDRAGYILMVGETDGAFIGQINAGSFDGFVVKFDLVGNLLWVKQFGNDKEDYFQGLATDQAGNVFISGNTYHLIPLESGTGAFLTKLDSNGRQVWFNRYEMRYIRSIPGIAVDRTGSIFVAGSSSSALNPSPIDKHSSAFIAKFDSTGKQIWINGFGTPAFDYASGIVINEKNNIFVTGNTAGPFLVRFNSDSSSIWYKKLDLLPEYYTAPSDIAMGQSDAIYITGYISDSKSNHAIFINSVTSDGIQR